MTGEAVQARGKPFPGIVGSFLWITLYFALQIVVTIVAYGITFAGKPEVAAQLAEGGMSDETLKLIAVPTLWGIVVSGALLLLLLWNHLRKDGRIARIGLDKWSVLPLGQTLGLGAILVGAGLAFNWAYSEFVVPGIELQDMVTKLLAAIPQTPVNVALRFLAVAVMAPLVEELLFRGLLQNALGRYMGPIAAIVVAALLFAGVHMQLYAFPALAVLGMAFGYLYYRTGSLRTNIALHMLNNAAALLVLGQG